MAVIWLRTLEPMQSQCRRYYSPPPTGSLHPHHSPIRRHAARSLSIVRRHSPADILCFIAAQLVGAFATVLFHGSCPDSLRSKLSFCNSQAIACPQQVDVTSCSYRAAPPCQLFFSQLRIPVDLPNAGLCTDEDDVYTDSRIKVMIKVWFQPPGQERLCPAPKGPLRTRLPVIALLPTCVMPRPVSGDPVRNVITHRTPAQPEELWSQSACIVELSHQETHIPKDHESSTAPAVPHPGLWDMHVHAHQTIALPGAISFFSPTE